MQDAYHFDSKIKDSHLIFILGGNYQYDKIVINLIGSSY